MNSTMADPGLTEQDRYLFLFLRGVCAMFGFAAIALIGMRRPEKEMERKLDRILFILTRKPRVLPYNV